jgi:hypothetical protein
MKKITEATRTLILNEKRRRKLEPHTRVGELLVQNKFIDEATRDEILASQRSFGAGGRSNAGQTPPRLRSIGRQALITSFSLGGVAIATLKYGISLELAIVVAGFLGGVLETIFQYKTGRSLPLSIQRAAFPVIIFVVLCLVFFATVSIITLKHDPSHLASEHSEEEVRIRTITLAFMAMVVAVGILLSYALWKFHALRFAESRLGATKDILIRVEAILSDRSKTLEVRRTEAIQTVLRGLRNAIRLSLADRILRLGTLFRQSFNQIRVLYFVHDASTKYFQLVAASYPEAVPDEVLEGFRWIRENHRPCLLNEPEFEKLKEVAKRANPEGWKTSYLNMAERHSYISVCGWIHDKQEVLISENASKCLALDNSFLRRMEEDGFGFNVLQWLEIGSFVGCRIVGKNEKRGVLLVVKNIRKGFPPEDIEVVKIGSQILGRILQST